MTPPVFGHGRLRLYLLSLLESEPMHGYELIQAIESNFGGTYTPSAGTIYPRLAKLEEEGRVSKVVEGRKTVYAITASGLEELADRRHELDDIESNVTDSVRMLADEVRSSVNQAMKSLRADLAAAAREARNDVRAPMKETQLGARSALRDAELALNDFRHNLRADLRGMAARGELTETHVTALTSEFDRVRGILLRLD